MATSCSLNASFLVVSLMPLLEPGYDRKSLKSQPMWFGGWVIITLIGAFLHPDRSGHGTHQQLGLPPCPSVLLFDRPCPGCGLTTSWTAFIHGDIAYAFHAHPLGPPMYILYTVSAFMALYAFFKNLRFSTDTREFNRVMAVAITVFVVFGFFRMATTPNFGTVSEHWLSRLPR